MNPVTVVVAHTPDPAPGGYEEMARRLCDQLLLGVWVATVRVEYEPGKSWLENTLLRTVKAAEVVDTLGRSTEPVWVMDADIQIAPGREVEAFNLLLLHAAPFDVCVCPPDHKRAEDKRISAGMIGYVGWGGLAFASLWARKCIAWLDEIYQHTAPPHELLEQVALWETYSAFMPHLRIGRLPKGAHATPEEQTDATVFCHTPASRTTRKEIDK